MEPVTLIEIIYNPGDAKLRDLLKAIHLPDLNKVFKESFAPLDEATKKNTQICFQHGLVWKGEMLIKIYLGFNPVNKINSLEKVRSELYEVFKNFLEKDSVIFILQA